MCVWRHSALQISHLNTVSLSHSPTDDSQCFGEKEKGLLHLLLPSTLSAALFQPHNVFVSSQLLIQRHFLRSLSEVHAIFNVCTAPGATAIYRHMYINVYICTYIYVDFNTRISHPINKRTSQSFAHGNRNETAIVPWDRPEIKSLFEATGSPLPNPHYYHVLELWPKNEKICSWVWHWRSYEKLQCCIHVLLLCK